MSFNETDEEVASRLLRLELRSLVQSLFQQWGLGASCCVSVNPPSRRSVTRAIRTDRN